MKSHFAASQTVLALSYGVANCSPLLSKRADDNAISSCGDIWMPRDDVDIAQGTDTRSGYDSAVDKFCSLADRHVMVSGDSYLSHAVEVQLSFGNDPATYGQWGFVYFEVHNRQDTEHTVNVDDCKSYLKKLSEDGGGCSGEDNTDTKGGTWQVIDEELSYHALPSTKPPQQWDSFEALYEGVIDAQTPNTGAGWPLNPFPLVTIQGIKPSAAHSHNDYDREIPLYTALSTGCISVEVDVWFSNADVIIGHDSGKEGRTLRLQYIEPLRELLDYNGGAGVYAANAGASFTILVDFKSDDDGTLDAVVAALEPLREQGYLSRLEDGSFVEKQVTIVASGNAPFDRISSGDGVPERDVFYDAKVNALGDQAYSNLNSYYASAKYSDAGDEESLRQQVQAAHDLELKVRYYDLNSEDDWEQLASWGVDRLNADDLANTARLVRL